MMYKVLFKDQYTSGYAKKIAGSYTLVEGFLIRQYSFQYLLSYPQTASRSHQITRFYFFILA